MDAMPFILPIRFIASGLRALWPFGGRGVEDPIEFAGPRMSTAEYVRKCLSLYDVDGKVVPRGTYTRLAEAIGTTPTYVSIVAARAGYTVAKQESA